MKRKTMGIICGGIVLAMTLAGCQAKNAETRPARRARHRQDRWIHRMRSQPQDGSLKGRLKSYAHGAPGVLRISHCVLSPRNLRRSWMYLL